MPSRLRVLVKQQGQRRPVSGRRAVAMAICLLRRQFMSTELPDGWNRFSLRQKLAYIGDKLPRGYELIFIREPRNTRKNKSLFLEMRGLPRNAVVELEG